MDIDAVQMKAYREVLNTSPSGFVATRRLGFRLPDVSQGPFIAMHPQGRLVLALSSAVSQTGI